MRPSAANRLRRLASYSALTLVLFSCAGGPPPAPQAPRTVEDLAALPAPKAVEPAKKEPPARRETPETDRRTRAAKTLREAEAKAESLLKELREKKRVEKAREEGDDKAALPSHDIADRYEKILNLPGTPPERKSEILLRLAELSYREEEAALRLFYESGTDQDLGPGEKYPRSIHYYQRLVDEYPASAQALTAFYNLGYLYSEEGEVVRSARAYGEVLKRDPKSDYAVEIHMRLAEADFTLGSYREAIAHYQSVLDGGKPEYVDKTLHKLGWCYYKLEDYATAVATFDRILSGSRPSPENLRTETIDILAKCFMEWTGTQGLSQYLKTPQGPKPFGDALFAKLGGLYADSSRFADAVAALTTGVDTFPLSDLALTMERGIIAAYTSLRDVEAANVRRQGWVVRYAPGTAWDAANGPRLAAERDMLLEEGLRLAALYRHSRAQRGEGKLPVALEIYRRYDALFGMKSEHGYEMSYAYAQGLKEAGSWAEAARRYKDVAEHPRFSSHREEAGYRRIEALDAARKDAPDLFDEFLDAHLRYVEQNPTAEQAPKVLFARGELAFEAERFALSREAFLRVAADYPRHALAPEAVERVARCWFREGVFDAAEKEARRSLSMGPSPEAIDRLTKLVSFSILKQAEADEAAKRLAPANRHFLRLAEEFPDSELAQVSLYRLAQNQRALGLEKDSAATFRRLAERYREGKFTESALTLSSEILSAIGDWKAVAVNYEDLYRRQPTGPDASGYLFRAALAREKALLRPEAAALFGEFTEAFPTDPRRPEAFFRAGKMLEENGDVEGAKARFRQAWEVAGEGGDSPYRTKAALKLAERQLEAFRAVELKGNLEEALVTKEGHLDQALQHLVDAASLPYPETLAAAMYLAGEAFEQMKSSLLDSERPAGMTEEEAEQYQFLLEEKAFPLEERAVEFYRKGLAALRRLEAHNEWADRMFQRLEALLPWAYQRSEQAGAAWSVPAAPRRGWERTP